MRRSRVTTSTRRARLSRRSLGFAPGNRRHCVGWEGRSKPSTGCGDLLVPFGGFGASFDREDGPGPVARKTRTRHGIRQPPGLQTVVYIHSRITRCFRGNAHSRHNYTRYSLSHSVAISVASVSLRSKTKKGAREYWRLVTRNRPVATTSRNPGHVDTPRSAIAQSHDVGKN